MSNMIRLLSLPTATALLCFCGFACNPESTPKKMDEKKTDVVPLQQPKKNDSGQQTPTSAVEQTEILKASEGFGHFIGRNLKTPGINFDLDSIIRGMRDGYEGKPAPMSDKEYEALMTKIQEKAYAQLAVNNLQAANDFMAKNANAEGVIVIEPGKLQYKIIKEGTGATVTAHDSPQIRYTGKFIDDTTFGSSADAGGPITIPLDQTIPGFSKGIEGMKEGETRKLFVHPDLGYGTTGHLPPNALLIFEVEVVKANAPAQEDDDISDLTLNDDDSDDDDDDSDDHHPKGYTGAKSSL